MGFLRCICDVWVQGFYERKLESFPYNPSHFNNTAKVISLHKGSGQKLDVVQVLK